MSTEKIVMNSLFGKTELKSTKVELALKDDIQKGLSDYKTLDAAITSYKNKARAGLDSYLTSVGQAYQNAKNTLDALNTMEAKIKELGLPDNPYASYTKDMSAKANEYKKLFAYVDNLGISVSK
jgi:SMC interacting uncharacterized protein involved in chromosome segregation